MSLLNCSDGKFELENLHVVHPLIIPATTISFSVPRSCPGMEIYVRIEGFEHVLWTQQESTGSGDNRRTRTVTYQDQS